MGPLLAGEFGFEGLLAFGDVALVAGGIDEGVAIALLPALVFLFHVVVATMCAEKDIAGQTFQHFKAKLIVRRDMRIFLVVDENVGGLRVEDGFNRIRRGRSFVFFVCLFIHEI